MKILLSILASLVFLLFQLEVGANSLSVVVPREWTTTQGPSNNAIPFIQTSLGIWRRVQQAYDSSEFLSGSTFRITSIAFRWDTLFGGSFFTIQRIVLLLSTTNRNVDGISTTFSNNPSTPQVTVYDNSVTVPNPTGQDPEPFNFVFHLATPFDYNPATGNLLLEIRNYDHVRDPMVAGLDSTGATTADSVARVFSDVNAEVGATHGTYQSKGLVTQFTGVSVATTTSPPPTPTPESPPTPHPTRSPTHEPSPLPSPVPSPFPSPAPSSFPTSTPTMNPSLALSHYPSENPTAGPCPCKKLMLLCKLRNRCLFKGKADE